jgi:putative ABC transport system permease protein
MFNLQANDFSYFGVKLKPGDVKSSEHIAALEKIYSNLFPGNPFDYFFLEDAMKQDLQPDLDFAKVFALFSGMSIVISLIGLLGLVVLNLRQRVKELGIRKVVGANFNSIFLLVFKTLAIPIGIALVIGIPLSAWGFSEWISEHYLYHIAISWYYLALPAILLPLMAALVIVFQVIRAYNRKIINSLKYE